MRGLQLLAVILALVIGESKIAIAEKLVVEFPVAAKAEAIAASRTGNVQVPEKPFALPCPGQFSNLPSCVFSCCGMVGDFGLRKWVENKADKGRSRVVLGNGRAVQIVDNDGDIRYNTGRRTRVANVEGGGLIQFAFVALSKIEHWLVSRAFDFEHGECSVCGATIQVERPPNEGYPSKAQKYRYEPRYPDTKSPFGHLPLRVQISFIAFFILGGFLSLGYAFLFGFRRSMETGLLYNLVGFAMYLAGILLVRASVL